MSDLSFQLRDELKFKRLRFLEACNEWVDHPCPSHLYNLDLFKADLGETIVSIRKAGLTKELLPHCNPERVVSLEDPGVLDEHPEYGMLRIEGNYLAALTHVSDSILIINKIDRWGRVPGSPSLNSFKYIKACVFHARRWLAEKNIQVQKGFAAPCYPAIPQKRGEAIVDRAFGIYDRFVNELGL